MFFAGGVALSKKRISEVVGLLYWGSCWVVV
jgi:hypothetical protein